tara:strand:+ start:711 stop:1394 length:684 start_codon:yes stop_codon:yes gene_type:complete
MKISNKLIIFFFLLFNSLPLYAHVQHYENLNRIEFDIYRNNKNIGKHIFTFKKNNELLEVDSQINFQIKKLGVVLYDYNVKGKEIYKDGKLIKFNSKTNQNGKNKFVNLIIDNNEFDIDGSSYKGKAPINFVLGTWWNHSIVEAEAQISAVSGRIIKQKVTFLGKKTIEVNGKKFNTLNFNFSSSDKKLKKNKRLNTNIWYDEKTMNWVKASFEKKGKWEYKLISIK